MDLYAALDVPRTADRKTIRRAYRRKAKKAHPDAGGSAREFAVISLAHNVLTDDTRRSQYDATGSVDDPPQDKSLTAAFQAVDAVLNACIERRIDPLTVDVIGDATKHLQTQLRNMDQVKAEGQRKLAVARKLAARFKARRGKANRIGPMIDHRIREIKAALLKADTDRPSIEGAVRILGEHSFEFDDAAPMYGAILNTFVA